MIEAKIERLKIIQKPMQKPIVCIEIPNEAIDAFENDNDYAGYVLTIKKVKKKSLNMNSYMWILCDKIAQKISSTKEEVYRIAIKRSGRWIDATCPRDEVSNMVDCWTNNGIGWWAETIFDGAISTVRLYIGSSVYTADELQRLTNDVVEEAKSLNIDTLTPDELEHLKSVWG